MITVIKNGAIVLPDGLLRDDIIIEDGKITGFGSVPADLEYDASGCLIFPGFIDAHTHLQMDTGSTVTADSFETGTRAALAGGTTTIIDFATQDKGGTLCEALAAWHSRADGSSSCNYGFHMAIVDWNDRVKGELPLMTKSGVTSYKVYMAYDALRVSDAEIFDILKSVSEQGGIVGAHCENGDIVNCLVKQNLAKGNTSPTFHPLSRPDYVEEEAIDRYISIAKAADSPVNIVHLSTKKGYERIMKARKEGQKVFIETCPQYLTLTDEVYELPDFEGAKFVCSPPIRKSNDKKALLKAVQNGDIDMVSTDHCSFNFHGQKDLGINDFSGIPNGLPGIEHRPVIFYSACVNSGICSPMDMARMLSENPARLFGMYPEKGVILPGSDADITIIDTNAVRTISASNQEQNVDYSPWEGYELTCSIKAVFLNGVLSAENGRISVPNSGRYIPRKRSMH